MDSFQIS